MFYNNPIGKLSRKAGGIRIKIPLDPPLGKGENKGLFSKRDPKFPPFLKRFDLSSPKVGGKGGFGTAVFKSKQTLPLGG